MRRLAEQLQRQFGVALLASFGLGLLLPAVGDLHPWVIPALLSCILFLACARITQTDLAALALRDVAGFYVARFLAVPAALYLFGLWFWPDAAAALMLLGLVPAGVTTAAIAGILGGNPAIALSVTAVSTLLAPLMIPLAFLLVGEASVDPTAMGGTLLVILVVPAVLYLGIARRSDRLVAGLREVGPLLSVGLICTIALLVSNGQQARILADPSALLGSGLFGALVYALLYALGALWGHASAGREQIGWTLSGGNNNIVLGLTLALLYLAPEDVVRFVAWDLAWICGLSAIQPVLGMLGRSADARVRPTTPA